MIWQQVATWVRAHPVAAFLGWFFPVGWAIAFIPVVVKQPFGLDLPLEVFLSAATLLGLLLPAVVITRFVDGPAGVQALRRRVFHVRASIGWYALALFAVPITALILAAVLYGMPDVTAGPLMSAVVSGLIVQTLVSFITINLWEETAWMGFVQARLQVRRGAMLAATITAAFFTLQHLPLFMDNGAGLVVILPMFLALAIPFRALTGWMYNRTGALFLIGLLHAVGDATGSGLLPRLYPDSHDGSLIAMLAQALIGLAVIVATRARLGREVRAAPRAATEIQAAHAASVP